VPSWGGVGVRSHDNHRGDGGGKIESAGGTRGVRIFEEPGEGPAISSWPFSLNVHFTAQTLTQAAAHKNKPRREG